MIEANRTFAFLHQRCSLSGLAALGLALSCVVPVAPDSEASAQVVAAAKRSAARVAATRAAAQRKPAGAALSASGCRAADNKCNGIRRENAAQRLLAERFPSDRVQPETFLRNRNGTKARDPLTGKGRRIDFVLFSGGSAVKRFEITSQLADKKAQIARELRILTQRKNGQCRTGPVYVRDRKTSKLVPIDKRPSEVVRLR